MTVNRRSVPVLATFLAIVAVVAACSGGSGPLGSVPSVSSSPDPSVAQGSPDATPEPSADESGTPSDQPSGEPSSPAASESPSTAPGGTTIVRAYFWLGGKPGSAGLLATLREVPGTKAVATAAMKALLAGPTAAESGRSISTAIPGGTQLIGLSVEGGEATVNLSSEFEAGGDSTAVQTRIGQVVYTLTQFPTIKSVAFQVEGEPRTGSSEGFGTKPLVRADFVALLPAIWVDRPAWNAAIGNPAHVTGSADVFEATFRIAILDGSGKVLVDEQAMATCGTGCRGTFDTSVAYTISKAQYGTLRVYDGSAKDGTPENVRDYRVWLTP